MALVLSYFENLRALNYGVMLIFPVKPFMAQSIDCVK